MNRNLSYEASAVAAASLVLYGLYGVRVDIYDARLETMGFPLNSADTLKAPP